MRNLTNTLAAVSLLAPVSAYPLGIGDIKLHSALNQNLNAEIALHLSAGESVSDLKVTLASPEKFDEAGVPWNYFLSRIKFETVVRRDGSTVVSLSSTEALREPFLDFLLEVVWANGSLYREFTVLVDPPVAYTQPVIPLVDKAQQTTAVIVSEPTKIAKPSVVAHAAIEGEYGPTGRNDTLWKVAEKTNAYNDVSIEQMMMALYEANPKAFYKDNVNALMAGKTLTIPDREAILKLSHRQAMAAFKQQDNAWRGRVVAAKENDGLPASDDTAVISQLELEAPVEAEIAETVDVVLGDDVSSDDFSSLSETDKLDLASSEKGMAALARVEKLEQQLAMMQKMLVLKDEQIAALQSQEKAESSIELDKSDPGSLTATTTAIKPTDKTTETVKAEVKPKVVKPKPKPAVKKPKPKPQPEPGFMDDPMMPLVGGIGVVILAVLGVLLWRKKKIEEEVDNESMFASASEISLPDSSLEGSTVPVDDTSAYDVGTVGESSFLSEFTPSDFDAFDTDQNEVDPISEADVYLAYGRYQQAEDLMRQAIVDQPERDECKLKLLEIFFANENKSAFEEYAVELVSSGKNEDHAFWETVTEMGIELNPECTIYSENGGDKANFETADDGGESIKVELENKSTADIDETVVAKSGAEDDFDLSVFDDGSDNSEAEVATDTDDGALDFDLSVFDVKSESDEKVETEDEASDDLEAVDFDLNTLALDDSGTEGEAEQIEVEQKAEDIESVDFDLKPESDNEKNDEEGTAVESLDDFDFSLDDDSQKTVAQAVSTEPEVEEAFDFDFDLDTPPSSPASDTLDSLDSEVSDLTDMDELETKIDLAKAYIDMGDSDAAKAIAEEVLEHGSAEQKETAQSIIDQLK